MRMPTNHKKHEALLTESMVAEKKYLSPLAPTFGRTAPEGYLDRAQAYNAQCKAIGATLMMVVEV